MAKVHGAVSGGAGMAGGALENARRVEWLETENRRLRSDFNLEHNMVGESPRMREVYQFIAKAAPSGLFTSWATPAASWPTLARLRERLS